MQQAEKEYTSLERAYEHEQQEAKNRSTAHERKREPLKTPPAPRLPHKLKTPPADPGPIVLKTPPADQGPIVQKTPPANQGPIVNAAGDGGGGEQLPLFDDEPFRVKPEAGDAGSEFGSGEGPHTASVTVTRGGEVVSSGTEESGDMTPEEAALGFPQSTLATHTEARAVRHYPLEPGDIMEINGQYPPCPTCKGVMNRAASSQGATIIYLWPGGKWTSNP